MRVEVTLKSGVTVTGYASKFEVVQQRPQALWVEGIESIKEVAWSYLPTFGIPAFKFLRPSAIDAVVIYPEASDLPDGGMSDA